jgi:acyl-CoA dehydrogenase
MYCSGGARADYITVFATADKSAGARGVAAFIVPKDAAGFSITKVAA